VRPVRLPPGTLTIPSMRSTLKLILMEEAN
jgi:hypothetical protein